MTDQVRGARLLGRTGEFAGVTHRFDAEVTIGRTPDNDLVLNSPFLSGRHARVFFSDGYYHLEDLGSRNGTRLDGVTVARPARLDRVHIITLADAIDLVYVRAATAESGDLPETQPASEAFATEIMATFSEPVAQVAAPPATPPPSAPPEPARRAPEPTPRSPAPPPAPAQPGPPPVADVHGATRYDLGFSALIDPRELARDTVPAVPVAEYDLVLEMEGEPPQIFPLKQGANVLGRAAGCDVVLPDPDKWLSRKHATLSVGPDGLRIEDNGTVNGTFVRDTRIESAPIEAGTTFRLGPHLVLRPVRR